MNEEFRRAMRCSPEMALEVRAFDPHVTFRQVEVRRAGGGGVNRGVRGEERAVPTGAHALGGSSPWLTFEWRIGGETRE